MELAGRVVARVTKHRNCSGGQVDDVGLAQGVPSVAKVDHVSTGEGRRRRRVAFLGGRRRWGCRAFLVLGWITLQGGKPQLVLVIGGVGAVHLL